MKKSEFRSLLREEIRKVMREGSAADILDSDLAIIADFRPDSDFIRTDSEYNDPAGELSHLKSDVDMLVKKYKPISDKLVSALQKMNRPLTPQEEKMLLKIHIPERMYDELEYNAEKFSKMLDTQIRALKSIL